MKALRTSQLAAQYALRQHVLASRKATAEKGHERLKRAEILERRRYEKRRDRVKLLEEELASQNRLCETHESVLKSIDPILASRVSRDDSGPRRHGRRAAAAAISAGGRRRRRLRHVVGRAGASIHARRRQRHDAAVARRADRPSLSGLSRQPMDLTIPAGTELPPVAGNPESTRAATPELGYPFFEKSRARGHATAPRRPGSCPTTEVI